MKIGKVIIYWDYELQQGADMSTKKYTDGIEDFNQTNFILDFLKKKNIKTCFAVLGFTALPGNLPYHAQDQIREMVKCGHEIGSHTHTHRRISQLSYNELIKELKTSKKAIEELTKTECISFVAPWDKPQYFGSFPIDFKPGSFIPTHSKLSRKKIFQALKETGYKTYRICPLTSRFKQLSLSEPSYFNSILSIPCHIQNGFSLNAKKLVLKAIKNKGLAIIYAHPRALAHLGEQHRNHFIDFINFLEEKIKTTEIEVITPQDLLQKEEALS